MRAIRDVEPLSVAAFQSLRELIAEHTGIVLKEHKRNFVAARLQRRLRALGLESYDAYYGHACRSAPELEHLINAITTNKTSFFRESHHFSMLADDIIPRIVERARASGTRRIRIWSAGCSSGEEAYSIAMTLLEHIPDIRAWDVKILASDIDTEVLRRAQAGIYPRDSLADVPAHLRARYFEESDSEARVNSLLRSLVVFRRINLNAPAWPIHTTFDTIFCRNVIIYFDQATQRRLFTRLAPLMNPEAMLVLGHSETLHWLPDMFVHGSNTTYYLRNSAPRPKPKMRGVTLNEVDSARRLYVGQVFATQQPIALRTLLGSCVAACLYDPEARVGGMNHFLLPMAPDDDDTVSARFGVHAMELLINAIMRQGGDRRRLQAKIFGGAHVIDMSSVVSEKNIKFVREFLATENIPIKAELLGGTAPLDVCMFTETGRVLARRLDKAVAQSLADAEERFARRHKAIARSDVVLF